jgi:hypothetical protein
MREIYRVVRERLTQIVWWKGLASSLVKRGQDIDFTLEEGTLLQRSLVWGSLTLGALDFASHYHDLRESVAMRFTTKRRSVIGRSANFTK